MSAATTGAASLAGRVSMVTGATGGIGRVIATELARLGATVVIVCREAAAGERLRQQIAAETGADRAEVIAGDLSSRTGLRHVAGEFTARHDRLHVLVNNAGAHYRKRLVNADGIEMHVAVDYLAGFRHGRQSRHRSFGHQNLPPRSLPSATCCVRHPALVLRFSEISC